MTRHRNGVTSLYKSSQAAYGSPPLGWRAEARELVPDEAEQAALARARELHGTGASVRAIAAALAAEGHRPKRGGCWHPETVRRILVR